MKCQHYLGRAAGNGRRVSEELYAHSILSVKGVQRLTCPSYAAVNNLIAHQVDGEILSEITGQARNKRFDCPELNSSRVPDWTLPTLRFGSGSRPD